MEQSLVGKVLSSWAIWPPMAGALSTRYTLKPAVAKVKRSLHATDPAANNHYVSKITPRETLPELLNLFFFHFFPYQISRLSNDFLENLRDVFNLYDRTIFQVNLLSSNWVMQYGQAVTNTSAPTSTACFNLISENLSFLAVSSQILPPPIPQQRLYSRASAISFSSKPGIFFKTSRGSSYMPLWRPR